MSAAAPQIPPRPSRASQAEASDPMSNAPKIPPRPQRRPDRSISPSRAEYSRSPLNEPPVSQNGRGYGNNLSSSDMPKRPSSAFLPSVVGEEGLEYASFDDQTPEQQQTENLEGTSPTQTRNVAADLPIHAPKASLSQSTATSRIQTVTRTDSSQAAAAGIGKSSDAETHPLKAKSSFSRSNLSVNQTTRPGSAQGGEYDEHSYPSVGLQVPMLKYAGDAQAPSPVPGTKGGADTPGGGYFKDASQSRNHHRKRSSRHEFGPPGSYGLHGHGLNSFHGIDQPKDQFEKDWYQKHPEEFKKEQGRIYDPGHPSHDWALSSDDLNKLVHKSSSRGLGMGASPAAIGTPSEDIGYLASEEYTSRMNSPMPSSSHQKRLSSGNHPVIASPLRKASAPAGEVEDMKQLDEATVEGEDGHIIHVDAPARRASKIGGGGYDPPTEDFGPQGGNTEEEGGWVVENGYGVPILASDEVAKNLDPSAEYLQPAVSPEQERRGSDYYAGWDSEAPPPYQTGRHNSQDKSRPGSGHGDALARVRTREAAAGSGHGTPLEEIEEYEPLFPDDEKDLPKPKAVDHLKRPDTARHHFPSQDIWEDVPESLQYQTTVDTPQEPEDLASSTTFEHPAKEQARKGGNAPTDRADFLSDEAKKMAKSHFKPGVRDDMRPNLAQRFPSQDIWEDSPSSMHYETTVDTPQTPEEDLETSTGSLPREVEEKPVPAKFNAAVAEEMRRRPDMRQRFPSQDIWEDTPDSLSLETTVSGPQMDEADDVMSPESAKSPQAAFNKPQLPTRPARPSKLSEESKPVQPDLPARPPQRLRQVPPADAEVPQLPARPSANKAPILPDRPKPQIPNRPPRTLRSESTENAPLAKTASNASAGSAETSSVKSPPEVKAKPAVPARPVNANFANLRAGFMNDLNSRLKIGPQAPKQEEQTEEETKPEEKAPLADARKGRARGPARRKPAPSAAAPADVSPEQDLASKKSLTLAISTTFTVWQIDETDNVSVPETSDLAPPSSSAEEEVEKIASANTDAAGPIPSTDSQDTTTSSHPQEDNNVLNTLSDPVGAEGDAADAAKLSSSTIDRSKAIESEFEAALADSNRHGETPASGATDVAAAVPDFTSEVPVSGGREAKAQATEEQRSVALGTVPAGGAGTERAAAAEGAEVAEEQKTQGAEMKDTSAQTGERDLTVRSPAGEEEKMTITIGGRAPEEGNVVQKDGKEILEDEKTADPTGLGM